MAEFPALPLWTDAYLADTRHLTTQEHGAYLLLLMEAWRRKDCALPDDDALWARLAGLDMRGWKRIKNTIRAFWTLRDDGYLEQKRLVTERQYVSRRSERAVTAARASHQARSLKLNKKVSANAVLEGVLGPCLEPAPTPTPIPIVSSPPRVPPKVAHDKGSILPENWRLSNEGFQYAKSKGFAEHIINEEAQKFFEYYTTACGHRAKRRNWPRVWQRWIRQCKEFKPSVRHPSDDWRSGDDRQSKALSGLEKAAATQAQGAGQRQGNGNGAGRLDAGALNGSRSIEGGLAGSPLADDVGGLPAGAGKLPRA